MRIIQIPFSGWYNSIHDGELDAVLERMFSDRETGSQTNQELLDIAFGLVQWHKVHMDYTKKYVEGFADLTKLEITFESMHSPREYNFTTDRVFGYITDKSLAKVLRQTKRENLAKQAADMFTSRSGFISYYSPDVRDWGSIKKWDFNQLGCLLQAWCDQEHPAVENDRFDQWAEYGITSDFSGNGYIDDWIYNAMPATKRRNLFRRLDNWHRKIEKEYNARKQLA